MYRYRWFTLGAALLVALPQMGRTQMIQRSSSAPSGTLTAPRPSSLPPIQMGSLPQRTFEHWDGSRRGFPSVNPCSSAWANCFSPHFRTGLVGIPYVTQTYVPYVVPVYVPYVVRQYRWAPTPQRIWQPYDPTKSRMLTIGEGADGGGGVMRIERLENKSLRLTWRGTDRPIREARLFVADSSQKQLKSARVDNDTPSAIFEIAEFEGRIAFTGLVVMFADGAMQTTLVPYPPKEDPPPQ